MSSILDRISVLAAKNSAFYKPLPGRNAIRLLRLEPGNADVPISCTLTVVEDYNNAPPYYASRYCWGLVADTTELVCDGAQYIVCPSLYAALDKLKHPHEARLLWVDAVCINQHDYRERNQQVSVMKQIYSHASRVFVWLGPGDQRTKSAVEAIYEIAHKFCRWYYGADSNSAWLSKLRSESNPTDIVRFPDLSGRSNERWPQISPIYERPWFQRIWVVQEVQSCEDTWLLCGEESIECDMVALVARWIAYEHLSGQPRWIEYGDQCDDSLKTVPSRAVSDRKWRSYSVQQASLMADRVPQTRSEVPFLWLLHRTRCFHSSDARDKVFAMLQHPVGGPLVPTHQGEVRESYGHLGMQVDYQKTATEVYHEVAVRSIVQSGTLEVLSYHWYGQPDAPTGQAWVPRWDIDCAHLIDVIPTWQYTASRSTRCGLATTGGQLVLRGVLLDTVSWVHSVLTNQKAESEPMASYISTDSSKNLYS